MALVGATWIAILALIVWCIWTGWETSEHSRLAWLVNGWTALKQRLTWSSTSAGDGDSQNTRRSLFPITFCLRGDPSAMQSPDPEGGS